MKVKQINNGEIHEVRKYLIEDGGRENIWCNTWYGHHIIGQDCEWYIAPPTTEQTEPLKAFLNDAEKLLYAINAETISESSAIELLRKKYSLTRKQEVPEAVQFAEWCVEFYGWSDIDELWVDNSGEKYSSMELYEIFKKQKS